MHPYLILMLRTKVWDKDRGHQGAGIHPLLFESDRQLGWRRSQGARTKMLHGHREWLITIRACQLSLPPMGDGLNLNLRRKKRYMNICCSVAVRKKMKTGMIDHSSPLGNHHHYHYSHHHRLPPDPDLDTLCANRGRKITAAVHSYICMRRPDDARAYGWRNPRQWTRLLHWTRHILTVKRLSRCSGVRVDVYAKASDVLYGQSSFISCLHISIDRISFICSLSM
jgi:hypothetical protein